MATVKLNPPVNVNLQLPPEITKIIQDVVKPGFRKTDGSHFPSKLADFARDLNDAMGSIDRIAMFAKANDPRFELMQRSLYDISETLNRLVESLKNVNLTITKVKKPKEPKHE